MVIRIYIYQDLLYDAIIQSPVCSLKALARAEISLRLLPGTICYERY
jgi:hypothetical protein